MELPNIKIQKTDNDYIIRNEFYKIFMKTVLNTHIITNITINIKNKSEIIQVIIVKIKKIKLVQRNYSFILYYYYYSHVPHLFFGEFGYFIILYYYYQIPLKHIWGTLVE